MSPRIPLPSSDSIHESNNGVPKLSKSLSRAAPFHELSQKNERPSSPRALPPARIPHLRARRNPIPVSTNSRGLVQSHSKRARGFTRNWRSSAIPSRNRLSSHSGAALRSKLEPDSGELTTALLSNTADSSTAS